MLHKAGWKTTECIALALFLLLAGFLLWKYGAAVVEGVKGLSYSVTSYIISRTWLKRKITSAVVAPDHKSIAAEVVKLIPETKLDSKAIALEILAHLRPKQPQPQKP